MRNFDGSITLLVVCHNRHDSPLCSNESTVQSVHVFGRKARLLSVPDLCSDRLVRRTVTARRHLPILALSGQPSLQIILLRCDSPEVPGAHVHDPMWDLEASKELFYVVD